MFRSMPAVPAAVHARFSKLTWTSGARSSATRQSSFPSWNGLIASLRNNSPVHQTILEKSGVDAPDARFRRHSAGTLEITCVNSKRFYETKHYQCRVRKTTPLAPFERLYETTNRSRPAADSYQSSPFK